MEKIELYTKMLEYVATVEIPVFNPVPDVVLWGSRIFRALGHPVRDVHDLNAGTGHNRPTAYVECFAYASLTESPGLPRWEPPTPPAVNRDARDVVGKAVAHGEPDTTTDESGQQAGYVVLSAEERAKGFVRPVRKSYIHVGRKICGKEPETLVVAGLSEDYVAWLCTGKLEHEGPCSSHKAVTAHELKTFKKTGTLTGCNYVTSMGRELAETYARDPSFYNGTFCSHCKMHFPVGADGEFEWLAETAKVGT